MNQIPSELLQRVLAHLDLESLRNAALSCRVLFRALKGAEELIVGEALLAQIHPDVFPEAFLVSITRDLVRPSVDDRLAFAAEYLDHQRRKPPPTSWSLTAGLRLARFHDTVSYLATQAAHDALAYQPRFRSSPDGPLAPSRTELRRFERALYRFQLHCHLFGDLPMLPNEDELGDIFFWHFAGWENEQLGCIFEYLTRLVALPINHLVEHDVAWGYHGAQYVDDYSAGLAQHVLVKGLEEICQLSKASNYEQMHALLGFGKDGQGEPHAWGSPFIREALQGGANPRDAPLVSLSEMSEEDQEYIIGEPFYDDPDSGPASMWKWINRHRIPGELVNTDWTIADRLWAFPFWDSSRLEAASLLRDPDLPNHPSNDLYPGLQRYWDPARLEHLEITRDLRGEIWRAGGSGYYDFQDASQVKWQESIYDRERGEWIERPCPHDKVQALLKRFSAQT
ncbi:hypothetical protein GGR56DRAFT_668419 [Xylariaceae sp. FL0804]|nr:hypothetical protein GGR56DRAFT_668419 [Xylariaceae sp. FL0804]